MADPVTVGFLAASALGMAAEAALKGAVGEGVKSAYKALKDKVAQWTGHDVEALEKTPASPTRQAVIAEAIDGRPAEERDAVRALADTLIQALKREGEPTISTVRADRGGVAAGRDMTGNTITTSYGGTTRRG